MKLRILLLAAGTTATLFAQAKVRDEVLERGRERILAVIEKLANYTCTETVNRQEFVQTVPRLPQGNCDQIDANRKNGFSHLELVREDRLRLDVEVTDQGIELYSWPGASRIASEHVQDFVGEGVFQIGAFGPFLINVFSIPGVRFWSEGTTATWFRWKPAITASPRAMRHAWFPTMDASGWIPRPAICGVCW
jgi:hypothetical protein